MPTSRFSLEYYKIDLAPKFPGYKYDGEFSGKISHNAAGIISMAVQVPMADTPSLDAWLLVCALEAAGFSQWMIRLKG